MMRNLALVLLAVCVSFAAVTVSQSFDGSLYTTNTPSSDADIHMDPHLYFENSVSASTDSVRVISGTPGDLENNAIVCVGDIDVQAQVDGQWAHGGLYQYVLYWLPCEPPSQSTVHTDLPITWDSDYYDDLFPEEQCDEDEPGCWGEEGTLVPQRVNVYDVFEAGLRYENKRGDTNVICKGVSTLNYDSILLDSSVIDTSHSEGTVTLTRGMHTITNTMDVQGCLGVVRFPQKCTPSTQLHEKIYGRTRPAFGAGAPGYSTTVGPATLNIRAVTDADLRGSAEVVSVTPSPVNILPGGTQRITITVRNSCSASDPLCQPITVTGVTASGGFTFRFDTGGMLIPIGYYTVNPGQAKTFNGILTAPAYTDCPAQLTFTAAYTYPGCTGTISGTPATVNVPFDCPPPPDEELNITDLVPRFTPELPSRVDIETGNDFDFSIITWNNGQNSSNPGETCVNIGNWLTSGPIPGPSVRIFDDLDGVSPIRYSYGIIPPGGSVVHDPISFSCTPAMENQTFLLIANVDCIPAGGGTTPEGAGESNNIDTRWLNCVPPGEGNITEEGGKYDCDISPSFQTGFPLDTYSFHVTCPKDGNPDDLCGGSIEWDSSSRNVTYSSSEDLDFYRITVLGGSPSGTVSVEANVYYDDGNATCRAELNVPTVPCEEFV